jgi:hypothetical protein
MASTVEGREGPPPPRHALDARASYLRVAERYEAMARAAEEAGDAVRAANQREAAASFRALAQRGAPALAAQPAGPQPLALQRRADTASAPAV